MEILSKFNFKFQKSVAEKFYFRIRVKKNSKEI
jgi:hypothetical protein